MGDEVKVSDVSEAALLDYFFSRGGIRLRNSDLITTFKPFISHSDPRLRAKYREEFKEIIDRIAVVKSDNGEKFLVLKKKYRLMLQDRDVKHQETDVTSQWDVRDETMAGGRTDAAAEQLTTQSNMEDELDSGSKSQWEDEDSTGSLGSAAVALDPIEKEWIYSAAGARVPDLSQLLRQDPQLANKKDFTSGFTALHWAAKHGSEDMAALVADAGADVNTKSHGGYTPLHIAALHGHRHILELLVRTYGAKENLRDYSGHLFCHYLSMKEAQAADADDAELNFQVSQARERHRNRKLASLFLTKKKWGSAEELAPIEEERTAPHQLALPAFRPRKFSR